EDGIRDHCVTGVQTCALPISAHSSLLTSLCSDSEKRLTVLDSLAILDIDFRHFAVYIRFDLVHQLHRLDDAEDLGLLYRLADAHEGIGGRRWRTIESAHDGRIDDGQTQVFRSFFFRVSARMRRRGRPHTLNGAGSSRSRDCVLFGNGRKNRSLRRTVKVSANLDV